MIRTKGIPLKVKEEPLTDQSIMTFGMFKGKTLANVENSWLQWFYEKNFLKKKHYGINKLLMKYISDKKEIILR